MQSVLESFAWAAPRALSKTVARPQAIMQSHDGGPMRTPFLPLLALLLIAPLAHADSDDLSGGVLLVHAPPSLTYTASASWCDSTHLDDCEDQVTSIPTDSSKTVVWFILSAWSEEKSFTAVEFGLGDFDPESFLFSESGLCLDHAMALYHGDWPGPNTGVAIASNEDSWTGQLVPIFWFAGINYAVADTIAITENPATEHAGWVSGESRTAYDAECLGALGLRAEGTGCCPEGGLDGEEGGTSEQEGETEQSDELPTLEDGRFAMVFDCLQYQGLGCPDNTLYWLACHWLPDENVTFANQYYPPSGEFPANREMTAEMWMGLTYTSQYVSFITHGVDFEGQSWIGVEWHDTQEATSIRADTLRTTLSCDTTYIYGAVFGPPGIDYYAVIYSEKAIDSFLSSPARDRNSIVGAFGCKSCGAYDEWHLDRCASYLCYEHDPTPAQGCGDICAMTTCLGCDMPPGEQVVPDAFRCWNNGSRTPGGMQHYPPTLDSFWCKDDQGTAHAGTYDTERECLLSDVLFSSLGAAEGSVRFVTHLERHLLVFAIQGTNSDDPAMSDWETLSHLTPHNQARAVWAYCTDRLPVYTFYRIVAIECDGDYQVSSVIRSTLRHAEETPCRSGELAGRMGPPAAQVGAELQEYNDGLRIPIMDTSSLAGGNALEAEPDSADCADVIVYSSTVGDALGFVDRCAAMMSQYPSVKTRYFIGGTALDDTVRAICAAVHAANVMYNDVSGTERFPTAFTLRKPLLLIVGDSDPLVVDHGWCDDVDSLCQCENGVACCPSDRVVWDLNEDGNWVGLVHRIPASTWEECDRACSGACQWNGGDPAFVDPERKVIMTLGDYGPMEAGYVVLPALYAASRLPSRGYRPQPFLKEMEYSPWCNDPEKHAAYRGLLSEGAAVDWGLGQLTSPNHWAGWFLSFPDSFPEAPCQRMIAIEAGCHTTVSAEWDPVPPFVEGWMFNDSSRTEIVGTIGHMAAGWFYREHAYAQRLYLDGWLSLCELGEGAGEFPLDWVVHYAAEEARAQGNARLERYFYSASTMGAFVMAHPGGVCSIDAGVSAEEPPGSGELRCVGNPGSMATFRMVVPARENVTLRIYDASGRQIATLQDGVMSPGVYLKTWLGFESNGRQAASGVYFARLEGPSAGMRDTRFVLVK